MSKLVTNRLKALCFIFGVTSLCSAIGCESLPSSDDPTPKSAQLDASETRLVDAAVIVPTRSCSGTVHSCHLRSQCDFGCFEMIRCVSDDVALCESRTSEATCAADTTCTWLNEVCILETDSCNTRISEVACHKHSKQDAAPCSWKTGCTGAPAQCSELSLEADCVLNTGCSWGITAP